jgi:protein gp37
MADGTGIEWTDATWNPVRGCSRVSEGCRNCYAEGVAARFSGPGLPYEGLAKNTPSGPRWTGQVFIVPKALHQPLRWKRPRRIFVNSMSDLFHESLSDQFIDEVFAVMALAGQHTFQVLTKRAQRMRDYFMRDPVLRWALIEGTAQRIYAERTGEEPSMWLAVNGPLPNVWLGVSVEDQAAADERIPLLLETPAAVRFLSCEPLLGAIDLNPLMCRHGCGGEHIDGSGELPWCTECDEEAGEACWVDGIDWVIVGGESGRGDVRPMLPRWVKALRDQCVAASVPFFFKQWGEWAPGETSDRRVAKNGMEFDDAMVRVGKHDAGAMLDGREWREFPKGNG